MSDDPVVQACRHKLLKLQFGWIKFTKNEKFKPGFVYPPDVNGIERAHEVDSQGYPSNDFREFFQFEKDIPPIKKKPAQLKKVNLMNKKFKFECS